MNHSPISWKSIHDDPRFQALHRKKTVFLGGLTVFSLLYYFMLPVGAACFPQLFATRIWGPLNVGLLFAFSEFLVAWIIAAVYARRANGEFDGMVQDVIRDVHIRSSRVTS